MAPRLPHRNTRQPAGHVQVQIPGLCAGAPIVRRLVENLAFTPPEQSRRVKSGASKPPDDSKVLLFFVRLLLFFYLGPLIPQGDDPVEHRLVRSGIFEILTEIPQPFELARLSNAEPGKRGFKLCLA